MMIAPRFSLRTAFVCAAACAIFASAFAAPAVRVAAPPDGGKSPDAEVDAQGAIHLAWLAGDNVWYAKSTDSGRTFGTALRVNSEPGTAHPPNAFRGPDLALGKDGQVHVVWYTNAFQRKLPKEQCGVAYAQLNATRDGFTPAQNLNHQPSDNYSLAADGRGNVAVVWTAGKLFVTASKDDGKTFAPAQAVADADPCECCATRAIFTTDGALVAAYRDKAKNVRDMYLATSPAGGAAFTREKLSVASWTLQACPMTGVFLFGKARGSRLLAAWETQGRINFAPLEARGNTPPREIEAAPRGKYPVALAAPDGTMLVAWKEGAQLHWRLFNASAQPLGEPGSAPAGGPERFAGVVTREGEFVLFP